MSLLLTLHRAVVGKGRVAHVLYPSVERENVFFFKSKPRVLLSSKDSYKSKQSNAKTYEVV